MSPRFARSAAFALTVVAGFSITCAAPTPVDKSAPTTKKSPTTKAAEDPDFVTVRAAITKSMNKVAPEAVTPTKTIADLGGLDIDVIEVVGEIQIATELTIEDDAVDKMVNTHESKKMSDLTVQQLIQLIKDARVASKAN